MPDQYFSPSRHSIQYRPRINSTANQLTDTPSPASHTYALHSSVQLSSASSSRKRPRPGGFEPEDGSLSFDRVGHMDGDGMMSSSFLSSDATSPPSLVNTRYRLAGGLDTPTEARMGETERFINKTESDYSRSWGTRVPSTEHPYLDKDSDQGHDGGSEWPPTNPNRATWKQYMYGVVGGLAGKVLNLCWTSAFQGFKAGGGLVYNWSSSPKKLVPDQAAVDLIDTITFPGIGSSPETYNMSSPTVDTPDLRPAKRLQTSHDGGWVVVNPTPEQKRNNARSASFSSTRSLIPRPVSSRGSAQRRTQHSTVQLSPASFTASSAAYGNNNSKRSASFAPSRSPALASSPSSRSPATGVARPFSPKRPRSEWDNDASMRRLNQQLKAMIKEGKEALATKVEVTDETGSDGDEYYA